jgi:hypothetical protein
MHILRSYPIALSLVLCFLTSLARAQAPAPNPPADFQATGPTLHSLQLTWTDTNADETGFEVQRSTDNSVFTVCATLGANVTSFTDTGLATDTTYWYVIRAVRDGRYSGYSQRATNRTLIETPMPSGWTGRDIGATGSVGSENSLPPTLTMNAGGTDIYNYADGFRYMSRTETGDLAVIARVDAMTNPHPWAKAGVMIRASLKPDSPNVAMVLSAANVCSFQVRRAGAEATTSAGGGYFNAPYWVKLVRKGTMFYGYISPDGATWRLVGVDSVAMPAQVYVGAVGCSHNPAAQAVISFSSIDAFAAPAAPGNPAVDNVTGSGGRLTWTDNSNNEDGFRVYVQEIVRDAPMNLVGTTAANATSFDLANLRGDTSYYVYVAALRGGESWLPVYTQLHTAPSAAQVPSAPAQLTVTPQGTEALALSWQDTSANETGFVVERAIGDGQFAHLASLAANVTTHVDANLTAGVNYTYRVAAANAQGASAYSEAVTGQTGAEQPPLSSADWTGRDIGVTGSTGSQSGVPPALTMNAGGTDIFGNADGFRSMFRAAEGDVTVVAFVQSMTNTHPWAKAGVMIRSSLEPNALNAAMLLTAGNVCAFQARATTGGATSSVSGGYFNPPYWVKITRTGNLFTGYIAVGGGNWRVVGSQEIAMPAQTYVGVVGSSHTTTAQTVVTFSDIAVTADTPPPPATWTRVAWQATASSAAIGSAGDSMVLKSTTPDLWGRSDGGTFVYQPVTGDDMMYVRVDSVTRADPYSKAGLMLRATLDSYSANACVVVTPERGIIFHVRRGAGEDTTVVGEVAGVAAPVRLWLARNGTNILASYSTDEGATWRLIGTAALPAIPPNAHLGPVATSHHSSVESIATFSQISR